MRKSVLKGDFIGGFKFEIKLHITNLLNALLVDVQCAFNGKLNFAGRL